MQNTMQCSIQSSNSTDYFQEEFVVSHKDFDEVDVHDLQDMRNSLD